jgi:stearoyl-CoA desaturase (delta-9 desaturase)
MTDQGPERRADCARVPIHQASWRQTYFHPGTFAFWAIHVAAIVGVAVVGISWSGCALALICYFTRMFFITAGYHRYFAHRSYKTSRWFQLVLAVGAQTTAQRGILFWAATHRAHHRHSDTEADIHSPSHRGFCWAHVGWTTSPEFADPNLALVKDLTRYAELRALDRLKHAPALVFALMILVIGGFHALVWGFLVSTVLLWHGTFTINSLSHMIGSQRYETRDTSRNHWALALITMGEGWHNNHHHYMTSANQGFQWWQVDLTFYLLRVLETTGIVWDVRRAPRDVIAARVAIR